MSRKASRWRLADWSDHGGAFAAMLAPGLVIWKDVVTPPDDAMELEVLARQWNWSYRLPGEDGQLGAVAVSHTSETTRWASTRLIPLVRTTSSFMTPSAP
jgi:heme/copper-type cytochrome/quinol oxidase subunit 2